MIQDIFPNRLDNQYVECSPQDNDVVFFFEGSSLLAKYIKEDTLTYPLYKQFIQGIKTGISKDSVDNYSFTYLLSVDDTKYFLAVVRRQTAVLKRRRMPIYLPPWVNP